GVTVESTANLQPLAYRHEHPLDHLVVGVEALLVESVALRQGFSRGIQALDPGAGHRVLKNVEELLRPLYARQRLLCDLPGDKIAGADDVQSSPRHSRSPRRTRKVRRIPRPQSQ